MRLILNLRGVDLVDVEFHGGSKGLFLDVSWFRPLETAAPAAQKPAANTADLSGTPSGSFERSSGPVWHEDQPVVVSGFGFQAG